MSALHRAEDAWQSVDVHRLHRDPKVIGVALAFSSSAFIGGSFVLTRKALQRVSRAGGQRAAAGGYAYFREPLWWVGTTTMVIGEVRSRHRRGCASAATPESSRRACAARWQPNHPAAHLTPCLAPTAVCQLLRLRLRACDPRDAARSHLDHCVRDPRRLLFAGAAAHLRPDGLLPVHHRLVCARELCARGAGRHVGRADLGHGDAANLPRLLRVRGAAGVAARLLVGAEDDVGHVVRRDTGAAVRVDLLAHRLALGRLLQGERLSRRSPLRPPPRSTHYSTPLARHHPSDAHLIARRAVPCRRSA